MAGKSRKSDKTKIESNPVARHPDAADRFIALFVRAVAAGLAPRLEGGARHKPLATKIPKARLN